MKENRDRGALGSSLKAAGEEEKRRALVGRRLGRLRSERGE